MDIFWARDTFNFRWDEWYLQYFCADYLRKILAIGTTWCYTYPQ